MDRRDFLAWAGRAVIPIATVIPSAAAAARGNPPGRWRGSLRPTGAGLATSLDKIGLQLYTVRQQMAESVERTLHEVARIGYNEVEFAGYFDRPPRAIKQLLDRNGLRSPSAHIGIDAFDSGWFQRLNEASEIGQKWLVVASLPESARNSLDAIKRTAAKLDKAANEAKTFGIRIGYHNHDIEFTEVEGRRIYDVLLEDTDPKLVDFELDIYWIVRGGGDPFAYFKKWPGRFPLLHLKDGSGPPDWTMTAVGKGTIDFTAILRAHDEGGFKHYYVENDNAEHPLANIATSYRYLRSLEF